MVCGCWCWFEVGVVCFGCFFFAFGWFLFLCVVFFFFCFLLGCVGLLFVAFGCFLLLWVALGCFGMRWVAVGLLLDAFGVVRACAPPPWNNKKTIWVPEAVPPLHSDNKYVVWIRLERVAITFSLKLGQIAMLEARTTVCQYIKHLPHCLEGLINVLCMDMSSFELSTKPMLSKIFEWDFQTNCIGGCHI